MEASPIQLGHSSVFLLNDNSEFKKKLERKLFIECLGSNREGAFVGPQPVSIERKDVIDKLFTKNYLVCEKSDGERMYLFVTKIDGKHGIFFVNRAMKFYIAPFKMNEECFEGSIFDGEFIQRTDGTYYFVIHDCWMYCGVSYVNEHQHVKRWHCIRDFIDRRVVKTDNDCCVLTPKIFYTVGKELGTTWKHITSTKMNNIDGLIFTPTVGNWRFGRDWELLKWKSDGMHTIDFQLKLLQKKISLQIITQQGKLEVVDNITPTDESWNGIRDFITQMCPENKTPIVEFLVEQKIDQDGWNYTPYRVRDDKTIPNGKITWENTLKNIKENLKIEDFVNIYLEANVENINSNLNHLRI